MALTKVKGSVLEITDLIDDGAPASSSVIWSSQKVVAQGEAQGSGVGDVEYEAVTSTTQTLETNKGYIIPDSQRYDLSFPETKTKGFGAVTYTGNGSIRTVDAGFRPDLVWIKNRDAVASNCLYDSVRGPENVLFSESSSIGESNRRGLTSFASNGFVLGDIHTAENNDGDNTVAWCWKAGGTGDNLGDFDDLSDNDYRITSEGATNMQIFDSPVGDSSVMKFTTTDNLKVTTNVLDVTNSFTVEMCIRTDETGYFWDKATDHGSNSTIGVLGQIDSTGKAAFIVSYNTGFFKITGTTPINDNKWHHYCASYDSTSDTFRLFVDGILEDSNVDTNPINNLSTDVHFGKTRSVAAHINCELTEIRIRNTAVSSITPPTSPYTHGGISTLLIHSNSPGSTTFSDDSSNDWTITSDGSPIHDGTIPYASADGSKAMVFDGDGNYLSTSVLNFGNNDFVFECYINSDLFQTNQTPFAFNNENAIGGAYGNAGIMLNIYSSGMLSWFLSSTGDGWDLLNPLAGGTIIANTWNHIAVIRSSNNFYSALNGTIITNLTSTKSLLPGISSVIGQQSGGLTFKGMIHGMRIRIGTDGGWTTNFTPPTSAPTKTDKTVFLMDSEYKNTLPTTNTDYNISSEVSVNQETGFSIVKYTGNGSGNQTVGHGLIEPPKFMIVKCLTTTHSWPVYHDAVGGTKVLYLDNTDAEYTWAGPWANMPPRTERFQVGVSVSTNNAGDDYIAYCWSEVPGYSKFGSYTGTGDDTGPEIDCGFEPAFIMVKCTSSATNWSLWDNSRGSGVALTPDSSNTEVSNTNRQISFTSNGFRLGSENHIQNGAGGEYIYIAFAKEAPVADLEGKKIEIIGYKGVGASEPRAWSMGGNLLTARENHDSCGTATSAITCGGMGILTSTEEYTGSAWATGGVMSLGRYELGVFGTQSSAIAAGGSTPITGKTESYNGSAWSNEVDLSQVRSHLASTGTQSAGLAIAGAITGTLHTSSTEEFNGTVWQAGGSLTVEKYSLAGCGTQSASIAFGGYNYFLTTTYAETDEYNGTAWSLVAYLPEAARGIDAAGTSTSALSMATLPASYDGTSWSMSVNMLNRNGVGAGCGSSNSSAIWCGGRVTNGPGVSNMTQIFSEAVWNIPGVWSTANNMMQALANHGDCGTQNAALCAGGMAGVSNPAFITQEYDGSTWTAGGDLSGTRYDGSGAGTQTAGLTFGGYTSAGTTGTSEEYNGTSWTGGGVMATARRRLGGWGTQSAGLAVGGIGSITLDTTEEYNGSAWNAGGTMNSPRRSVAGCGTQSAGLIVGGYGGAAYLSTTEEYDGTTWTWSAGLPNTINQQAVFGTQNSGASTGGYGGGAYQSKTDEFNGVVWYIGGSLSEVRYNLSGAGSSSNGISMGGYVGGIAVSITQEYNKITLNNQDVIQGVWSAGGSLSTGRWGHGSCGTQNAGLSWGGSPDNGSSYINSTEEYDGSTWVSGAVLNNTAGYIGNCGSQNAAVSWGGHTGSYLNTCEEYNGSSWSSSGILSESKFGAGGCGTQNAGLSFGGRTSGGASGRTEEFNGSSWTTTNDLNIARYNLSGCGTQNAGLSFGGQTDGNNTTEEYNGTAWSFGDNLITGKWGLAGCGTQSSALSFSGTNSDGRSATSEEYNGSIWTVGGNSSVPTSYSRGAGSQSSALSSGGSFQGAGLSISEHYDKIGWNVNKNDSTGIMDSKGLSDVGRFMCVNGEFWKRIE